ncbi:MAG: hypothetical protein ACYC9Z_04320 [Casimicrobiaceae bacterium]
MNKSLASRSCIVAIAMSGIANYAFAATCGTGGQNESAADIQALLVGRYACVHGGSGWNEILAGGTSGTVTEYAKGPSDPVDPSQQVATYTISTGSGSNPDFITYNYGTGGSFSYAINPKNSTGTGTYNFCNIGTGAIIVVTVQTGTSC